MSLQAFESTPPRRTPAPRSLFRFLTDRGGLKPCGELRMILDGAHGWMIRRAGMTLDQARRACIDAGYMSDPSDADGSCSDSTVNDLLDLIDAEARGHKQYAWGEWPQEVGPDDWRRPALAASSDSPPAKQRATRQRHRHDSMKGAEFTAALDKIGLKPYRAPEFLGLSLRQVYRITAGEYEAPIAAARLLRLMAARKISAADAR